MEEKRQLPVVSRLHPLSLLLMLFNVMVSALLSSLALSCADQLIFLQ